MSQDVRLSIFSLSTDLAHCWRRTQRRAGGQVTVRYHPTMVDNILDGGLVRRARAEAGADRLCRNATASIDVNAAREAAFAERPPAASLRRHASRKQTLPPRFDDAITRDGHGRNGDHCILAPNSRGGTPADRSFGQRCSINYPSPIVWSICSSNDQANLRNTGPGFSGRGLPASPVEQERPPRRRASPCRFRTDGFEAANVDELNALRFGRHEAEPVAKATEAVSRTCCS
ncbi:hypothetical protein SAMN05444164_3318 [Bradyrhizobium erythrophlei]|uniref:Uncharacterized protein n=1 Tax=Bradyrhizobium erythrophlei TaxID=1437360 RepID=A0A1H4X1S3_9BRAD|nr:hypothetical protein SAMN05444164_3318 [Bradyrhizobium erythrophlei]